MIPKSYKINDGCWNCSLVFTHSEYDEDTLLYCTEDGSKRPLCGSSCMKGENIFEDLKKRGFTDNGKHSVEWDKEFFKLLDAWESWSKDHAVNDSGICEKYK